MSTLAEVICELSRQHCRSGGLILGQNLEAVQSVCGTVPIDEPNCKIMPTCEAAGIGMAIGAALSGRPVIHVIRFASFLWLQASPIVYYAARAKSLWGYDLPLFIRVSSDDGIGPTHSGAYHSPFVHMPGLKVVAPITPQEYRAVWTEFQETRQPVLVSEQRVAYSNRYELLNRWNRHPTKVLIIAMSAARLAAMDAYSILSDSGVGVELYHLWNLKPSEGEWLRLKQRADAIGRVLVVDNTFEPCSVAEHVAYELLTRCNRRPMSIEVLGMKEPPGILTRGGPSANDIVTAVKCMR